MNHAPVVVATDYLVNLVENGIQLIKDAETFAQGEVFLLIILLSK